MMKNGKKKNGKKIMKTLKKSDVSFTLEGKDAEKFEREIHKPETKRHKKLMKEAEEVYKGIKQVQKKNGNLSRIPSEGVELKKDLIKKKEKLREENVKVKKPKKERIVTQENFNPQRDRLWTPAKGNKICYYCWKEKQASEVKEDYELGYPVCDECQEKRKEIRKKADLYWKGHQPTIRRDTI